MKKLFAIFLLTCACIKLQAQVNIITTIAGTDSAGYCCDGGAATNAKLNVPEFICLDNFGNLYIADCVNSRVRKINLSTGIISTIAGTDIAGYNGDNQPATNSRLYIPEGVFTDTSGNVYISDAINRRIRKVTVSTGIITTIAGNGISGNSGDGGLAINAELNAPVGLCLDKFGNIYFGDYTNNKIRKIDVGTGIITTFAGTGGIAYTGDGGPATNATFNGPIQPFADSMGNVFICDQWNHAIRKVAAGTGIITTLAGNGVAGYMGDGGLAVNATLNQPCGVYVDNHENIYIAEYGDGVIRRIDGATGIISTVAGTGTRGYSGDGGPATAAELKCGDVFLDNNGIIYIADEDNNRIRMVYNDKLGVPFGRLTRTEVSLYPNPAENEITIENAEGSEVRILNLLGQEPFDKLRLTNDKESISTEQLITGVYVVEIVKPNGEVVTKRLVVAR